MWCAVSASEQIEQKRERINNNRRRKKKLMVDDDEEKEHDDYDEDNEDSDSEIGRDKEQRERRIDGGYTNASTNVCVYHTHPI